MSDPQELIEWRISQLEKSQTLLAESLDSLVREFNRAKWIIGGLLIGNMTVSDTINAVVKGVLGG